MADDLEGGLALAAWLTSTSTLRELARRGVIPPARAAEMIDDALHVVERVMGTAEPVELAASARERLEWLLKDLQRLIPGTA